MAGSDQAARGTRWRERSLAAGGNSITRDPNSFPLTFAIVAPISATGVIVPVIVGVAGGDRPGSLQVAGVAAAALALFQVCTWDLGMNLLVPSVSLIQ